MSVGFMWRGDCPWKWTQKQAESVAKNCEGCCGEGFWVGARQSERRIPAAGFDARDNEAPSQKNSRPEGFRAKGRLASLLLSRRPTRGMDFPSPANWFPEAESCADAHGSLLRPASPSSLLLENSIPRNFQTGSDSSTAQKLSLPVEMVRHSLPRTCSFRCSTALRTGVFCSPARSGWR